MKTERTTDPRDRTLTPARVLARREIVPGVHVVSVERHMHFRAGQVIALARAPDSTPRLYSIASGTAEQRLDILFDSKPDGELTPWLARVEPGAVVFVSAPFGEFLGDHAPAWWIGAGTGIAPFVSMLRSGLAAGKTVVHGARSPEGFFFQDVFAATLGDRYVRCCSRGKGPGLVPGRLTDWLAAQSALPVNVRYMLCGSTQMVVAVRDLLLEKHVPYGNIIAEIYF